MAPRTSDNYGPGRDDEVKAKYSVTDNMPVDPEMLGFTLQEQQEFAMTSVIIKTHLHRKQYIFSKFGNIVDSRVENLQLNLMFENVRNMTRSEQLPILTETNFKKRLLLLSWIMAEENIRMIELMRITPADDSQLELHTKDFVDQEEISEEDFSSMFAKNMNLVKQSDDELEELLYKFYHRFGFVVERFYTFLGLMAWKCLD